MSDVRNDGVLGRRTAWLVRWGPWVIGPLLLVSSAGFVNRIVDGDSVNQVVVGGFNTAFWVSVLVGNRAMWRRHRSALARRESSA
ncbi:hypothetical protein [Streptomyces sp. NPDC060194]|uniref:hypothetical protein n=1 Tax=Streptomyces sp. NPDC060194 TaxID=3347069 RepID=UPI003658464F